MEDGAAPNLHGPGDGITVVTIRSEDEYRAALAEIRRDRSIAREQERLLASFGLKPHEVEQTLAPIRAQTARLRAQVAVYERSRRSAA